jgi:hypothetical protein
MHVQCGGMSSVFVEDCHLARIFQQTLKSRLLLVSDVTGLCKVNVYIVIQIGNIDEPQCTVCSQIILWTMLGQSLWLLKH